MCNFDAYYPKLTEVIRLDLALWDKDLGTSIGRLKTIMPQEDGLDFDVSILVKDGTSPQDTIMLLKRAIECLENYPNVLDDDRDDRIDWNVLVNIMRGVSIDELRLRMDDPAYEYTDHTKWLYDKIAKLEAEVKP